MHQKAQEDYQLVNPYEMMYHNMNLQINEGITRETAEKIARQLGFMHNAFGLVAKDLIKILSIRFSNQGNVRTDCSKAQVPFQRHQSEGSQYRERLPLETMDIEGNSLRQIMQGGIKKRVLENVQREASLMVAEPEGSAGFDYNSNRIQQKPPNADFLCEFAYEKSGHEESKIVSKQKLNGALQEKMSKIVENIVSKRKKESKKIDGEDQKQERKMKMNLKLPLFSQKDGVAQPLNNQERQGKEVASRQKQLTVVKAGVISNHQEKEEHIFQQFEYSLKNEKKSNQPEPVIVVPKPEQVQPVNNRLWQLLNSPKQSRPPLIYEISDDD